MKTLLAAAALAIAGEVMVQAADIFTCGGLGYAMHDGRVETACSAPVTTHWTKLGEHFSALVSHIDEPDGLHVVVTTQQGVMTGESVARVLASNHPGYAEGDIVVAVTGLRTHALSDGIGLYSTALRKLDPAVAPVRTALGVLGMPGFTAYSGLRSIGKPQPGETVVVAAASGPVGSLGRPIGEAP